MGSVRGPEREMLALIAISEIMSLIGGAGGSAARGATGLGARGGRGGWDASLAKGEIAMRFAEGEPGGELNGDQSLPGVTQRLGGEGVRLRGFRSSTFVREI